MQRGDFGKKIAEIKETLLDYLKWFEIGPGMLIDKENGLVKMPWKSERDDEIPLTYIVRLARLLAHLRGVAPTWNTYGTQGSDYSYTLPSIEEPDRAMQQLTNLARGHALSQGRNYITLDVIPIVINVVLSTAFKERVTIFDLLLAHDKLQLTLSLDKKYYQDMTNKVERINRAKRYEEIIGRRHVTYTFSPNGRVEIAIRSSDMPFTIETDEDVAILFSFLGQVRDRLIYLVSDVRERAVPLITDWILKNCDVNRDVEVDEKAQLCLPNIQLKLVNQVLRIYTKSLHDRAVCRLERSLTLDSPVTQVLDDILLPMGVINEIKESVMWLERKFDSTF